MRRQEAAAGSRESKKPERLLLYRFGPHPQGDSLSSDWLLTVYSIMGVITLKRGESWPSQADTQSEPSRLP